MSLYIKALQYQIKANELYSDPDSKARMETYKSTKNSLKAAFLNLSDHKDSGALLSLAAGMVRPSAKSSQLYSKWLDQKDKGLTLAKVQEMAQKKLFRVAAPSLKLVMDTVLAEQTFRAVCAYLPPAYAEYKDAKDQFKDAVIEALQNRVSPNQLVEQLVSKDSEVSGATISKVLDWANKINP